MPDNVIHEAVINAVQYQTGSIVSRQLIKKPNGNITLFAFAKGESLTEHTSPFEAVVQMIDGSMEITVGGTLYTVKAGEILIMPANIPHGLRADENAKMLLTMIK
ncbi:MAG: cupin domain-containing protein [Ignavibacteriaceae bacterium]|nr:cupin domain-containing protein [Ignavibacteriaceae bacterium]